MEPGSKENTSQDDGSHMTLYMSKLSAHGRSVRMLCSALGLKPNYIFYNLFKGEQINPDFEAVNPYHIIPTLVDGDFVMWESRAVLTYLVTKYGGENHSMYPCDLQKRAKIDMCMYTDATSIYVKMHAWILPIMLKAKTVEENEGAKNNYKRTLRKLESNILKENKFFTGDDVTLADLCFCSTIISNELLGLTLGEFPRLNAWMNRMKALPYVEEVNKVIGEAVEALANNTFDSPPEHHE